MKSCVAFQAWWQDTAVQPWAIELWFSVCSRIPNCRNASFCKLMLAIRHDFLSMKHMQRSPIPAAKTSNKNVCTRPVNGSLQTQYLIGCLISETRFHSDFFFLPDVYEWLSSPVWVSAPVFRHVPGLPPHGEGFISRGWEVAAEENSCLANCMHC